MTKSLVQVRQMRTDRIARMEALTRSLCDEGLRKTTLYGNLAASLKQSAGLPRPLRRALAFKAHLEACSQPVFECEQLVGSILGMWPVDENPPDYEACRAEAVGALDEYFRRKRAGEADLTEETGASFDEAVYSGEYRFALMARDHYDARISFADLQRLIKEMNERYAAEPGLAVNQIAKLLERLFVYDYGAETRALLRELPWNAANHTSFNFARPLAEGLDGLRARIPADGDEAQAMRVSLDAASAYIERYACATLEAARTAADEARRAELAEIARALSRVAHAAPDGFFEAMELLWMLHLISNLGGGSAMSLGRFDQYMLPFYQRDIAAGRISRERAFELVCSLWLKLNEPKMRTVQSVCLGGVTPAGEDAANELTRLCLEVTALLRLPYPNVSVRVDPDKSPGWLLDEILRTVKAGGGMPMVLNDKLWTPNLHSLGIPLEWARDYYNMGCVEIMVQGRQPNWGSPGFVIFPKVLSEWIECCGDIEDFETLLQGYLTRVAQAVSDTRALGEAYLEKQRQCFDPFASIFVDGCLERGQDYFQGGPVLGAHLAISGQGLGTAADALSAVRRVVFEEKRHTLSDLRRALRGNFRGFEQMRADLARAPAYGNDDDVADELAARLFGVYSAAVRAQSRPGQAEKYVNNVFSYNMHVAYGELTGATPNGRLAGETVSDCVGPTQGRDENGPTALLNSVLKLPTKDLTGAFALNLKISPSLVRDDEGTAALKALLRAYLRDGGPQIQINYVNPEELVDARVHPERHRDLVVRIAGYCEYFVNLDDKLQREIISRSAHGFE